MGKSGRKKKNEENTVLAKVKSQELEKKRKLKADFSEKLISQVELFPCLWERSHSQYKNQLKKTKAWTEVAKILDSSVADIKKAWKNLSDTFRRNLDLCYKFKSGDEFDEDKLDGVHWKYFKTLLFLKDSFKRRPTTSNYQPMEDESNSGSESESSAEDGKEKVTDSSVDVSASPVNVNITAESTEERQSAGEKRKRTKYDTNAVLAQLSDNANIINKLLQEPEKSTSGDMFLGYLGQMMGRVPAEKKFKCEQTVIRVVSMFIEGGEVEVLPVNL